MVERRGRVRSFLTSGHRSLKVRLDEQCDGCKQGEKMPGDSSGHDEPSRSRM